MPQLLITDLNEGDLIQLKSGGPMMTVTALNARDMEVHARWFSADGELNGGDFRLVTIKKVPDED